MDGCPCPLLSARTHKLPDRQNAVAQIGMVGIRLPRVMFVPALDSIEGLRLRRIQWTKDQRAETTKTPALPPIASASAARPQP
jgi:hypothetical protein